MFDICERKVDPKTTRYDVRWGKHHNGETIWVFLISGGGPSAYWNGWKNT